MVIKLYILYKVKQKNKHKGKFTFLICNFETKYIHFLFLYNKYPSNTNQLYLTLWLSLIFISSSLSCNKKDKTFKAVNGQRSSILLPYKEMSSFSQRKSSSNRLKCCHVR